MLDPLCLARESELVLFAGKSTRLIAFELEPDRVPVDPELSSVEIKPATDGRNDPASGFCVKRFERRGILLSNKPGTKDLQRACLEEKC
jgi:hypothetical protein